MNRWLWRHCFDPSLGQALCKVMANKALRLERATVPNTLARFVSVASDAFSLQRCFDCFVKPFLTQRVPTKKQSSTHDSKI